MTNRSPIKSGWFLIALWISFVKHGACIRQPFSSAKEISSDMPRGVLKTIKLEDGDVFDCVDIYEQPAFRHPHHGNHTIQMRPSFQMEASNNSHHRRLYKPMWRTTEFCPQGTIPLKRNMTMKDGWSAEVANNYIHKHAVHVFSHDGVQDIYGGTGWFNVWNPQTRLGQMSLAQIWVSAGPDTNLNTVEAGWMVLPMKYGDTKTKFFIFYTNDGYQTKCYDFDCGGFVQVSPLVFLGGTLHPVSHVNGAQYEVEIRIKQDVDTRNWWLLFQNIAVGYWRGSVFPLLVNGASQVHWGGEIAELICYPHSSPTQMGSGHHAIEGYEKAAYVRDLRYLNRDRSWIEPSVPELRRAVTVPLCASLGTLNRNDLLGFHFFYGGPGCTLCNK